MLLEKLTDYFLELLKDFKNEDSNKLVFQIGPQYDYSQRIVKKILISQFLTLDCIIFALKEKCNVILCRYGLIFPNPVRFGSTCPLR